MQKQHLFSNTIHFIITVIIVNFYYSQWIILQIKFEYIFLEDFESKREFNQPWDNLAFGSASTSQEQPNYQHLYHQYLLCSLFH